MVSPKRISLSLARSSSLSLAAKFCARQCICTTFFVCSSSVCPIAMMSTAAFSRYLFTTHVEPLNPLSSSRFERLTKSTSSKWLGFNRKIHGCWSSGARHYRHVKMKISTEVVVSVMSFPNFSMSTIAGQTCMEFEMTLFEVLM